MTSSAAKSIPAEDRNEATKRKWLRRGTVARGPKPKPLATRGGNCLNALINGRPLAVTNPLPRFATELLGVEIYASPRDVPTEYQRYVWQGDARQTTTFAHDRMDQPCSLVVYWTTYAGTH